YTPPPPAVPYTFPLHDALPIWPPALRSRPRRGAARRAGGHGAAGAAPPRARVPGAVPRREGEAGRRPRRAGGRRRGRDRLRLGRSEEHTSELQSRENLVCRLLL